MINAALVKYYKKTVFILFLGLSVCSAQPVRQSPASLGLKQLNHHLDVQPSGERNIDKFEIDALNVKESASIRISRKGNVDIVVLKGAAVLSRPMRAKKGELSFISFGLLGSLGTIVDVGGAKIGVGESSLINGYANIMVSRDGGDWVATPLNVPFRRYDGSRLATLPVLTIRLSPVDGIFDLYANSQLLVEGIDYTATANNRQIRFIAGVGGANLMGLVQSDENPLYLDQNRNGIDDDFELAHTGALAKKNSTKQDLKMLHSEWRKAERFVPPPPLFVARPRADN